MRLLPKSISPVTIWGGVISVIIIGLVAIGPGEGHAVSFLLPLAGPLGFMAFLFGINGWVPHVSNIDIFYIVKITTGSLCLAGGCLFLILCHSYWRAGWAVFLTVIGYLLWLLLGFSVTFVAV